MPPTNKIIMKRESRSMRRNYKMRDVFICWASFAHYFMKIELSLGGCLAQEKQSFFSSSVSSETLPLFIDI